MGDLMRQYWIPVVGTSEVEAGGRVKRVRILGEDLVVYRAPIGTAGLFGECWSLRLASMYFGRNEASGMRCVYHGWKFGHDGRCIDMPNVPPEDDFKDKVRHPAYPCAEQGGVIWAYMGPADPPPGLPELEWATVPESQRFVSKFYQECNYIQGLEGGIDPSHISFLHAVVDAHDTSLVQELHRAEAGFGFAAGLEKAPHIEVTDTDYGVLLGARRQADPGMYYWRITHFHMPFYTMPPTETKPDPLRHLHIWVPMDDERVINWCISWHPNRDITDSERQAFESGMSIHLMDYAPATSEGIEARGRLVVEDDLRIRGDGARDADALSHPAGELARKLGHDLLGIEVDEREPLAHDLLDARLVELGVLPERIGDVVEDGKRVEQRRVLEDHPDLATQVERLLEAQIPDVLVEHANDAGIGHEKPQDQLQDGRLSGARFAGDHQRLAPVHLQRDAVENRTVERQENVLEPDDDVLVIDDDVSALRAIVLELAAYRPQMFFGRRHAEGARNTSSSCVRK
jgi:phenylpropionate dioxygenase-like ring-hydroxylating dioxygenase large terminal subunit